MSDQYVGQCLSVQKICALVLYTGTGLLLKKALEEGPAAKSRLAVVLLGCPGGLLSAVLAGLQLSRSESCLWHWGMFGWSLPWGSGVETCRPGWRKTF